MVIRSVMRRAWTHKFQSNGPTVYSLYTVMYMHHVFQFISNIFVLCLWEHPGVLRILSEANADPTSNNLTFCYIT